jgi:uroporphyrinogen-III synthase
LISDASPLTGVRILITRAEQQAKPFVERLKELGAEPIEIPVIEIRPPDSWNEFDAAVAKLDDYDWIVFASANAVKSFAERTGQFKAHTHKPLIAVMGHSTERVAHQHGLKVAYKPDKFISESFIEQFPGYPNLSGLKLLWPRTNIGRNFLQEEFARAGAQIDVVEAYKTCLPGQIASHCQNLQELMSAGKIDVITLASAQTATNLALIIAARWTDAPATSESSVGAGSALPAALRQRVKEVLKNVTILSIGPETSSAAREHLGKLDLEANPHNSEGMIDALIKHFAGKKSKTDIQTI